MTIDYLTREEFQAYLRVEEKKEEIEECISGMTKDCGLAIINGGGASFFGYITITALNSDHASGVATAIVGILGLLGAGAAILSGHKVVTTSRKISSLEKELEQFKAAPLYRTLISG